jgi:trimethylamine--corrinoid protein Co-methyltransferase
MQGIKCSPRYKVLSDEQVEAIHEASLDILERTGIRFDSENARKRLLKAGASSNSTRKGVITFPRKLVEAAIRKVPKHGKFYARDPKNDIEYDGEHLFPYAGGGDPKILDLETGRSRLSTYADVEMATRLGDALKNSSYASSLVMANDFPSGLVVPKTMEAMMRNSAKAVAGYAPNRETVDVLVKMWSCISGGVEELRKRPIFSLSSSPSSPLTYGENNCEVLIRSLEYGIPFCPVPCPICGETGPMTLSGSLAQQNAEILGGLVLMQTIDSTLPVVYSGRVCIMDPRSGRDLWGVPEEALGSVAIIQLARKYGMISDASGMASDMTRWDLQMGLELVMTVLPPALAGAEGLSGLGTGWEGASSLEMMVIGNEVFEDVSRLMRGFDVDDGRLAVDMIDKVGHMGNFLSQAHTMEHVRRGEVRISSLWDKRTSDRALKEGLKPLQEAAKDRVRSILKEHVPEPLDRDIERDIERVMKDAQKTLLK